MQEITTKVAFTVRDRMVVTDPCYIDEGDTLKDLTKFGLGVILDGCKGIWVAEIELGEEGRVSILRATKHNERIFGDCWERVTDKDGACVDSGQMFIGCVSEFPLDYDAVLAHYKTGPNGEWVNKDFFGHGEGAISSTGYGDGGYPVYVQKVNGYPVAVEVRFMEDEDEDEGKDY